jgi:type VI protein secretion system component Hcp
MSSDAGVDGYMYFVGEGKYKVPVDENEFADVPIGKIKGETLDKRFETHGAFKIWSFNWSSAHDTTSIADPEAETSEDNDNPTKKNRRRKHQGMSGKRKDAAVSVGAFEVTKDVDLATPSLFYAHARCAVFSGCHVYFRKTGGGKLFTFFHAAFSDVIIEKWSCNIDSSTKETIVVNFDWCQLNYFPQSSKGAIKKDTANIKQICVSDPDSDKVPRVLTSMSVADMDLKGMIER